nr:MAG TPA: hypothetical protein [Caudoviricetes sp.]
MAKTHTADLTFLNLPNSILKSEFSLSFVVLILSCP